MKGLPGPWEAYVACLPLALLVGIVALAASDPGPMPGWLRGLAVVLVGGASALTAELLEEVCSWYDEDHEVF